MARVELKTLLNSEKLLAVWQFSGAPELLANMVIQRVIGAMSLSGMAFLMASAAILFTELRVEQMEYLLLIGLGCVALWFIPNKARISIKAIGLVAVLFMQAAFLSRQPSTTLLVFVPLTVAAFTVLLTHGARAAMGVLLVFLGCCLTVTWGVMEDRSAALFEMLINLSVPILILLAGLKLVLLVIGHWQKLATKTAEQLDLLDTEQLQLFELLAGELRTPIAELRSLISDDVSKPVTRKTISASSRFLLRLVDDLRNAIGTQEMSPPDVNDCDVALMLHELGKQMRPIFLHKDIRLRTEFGRVGGGYFKVDVDRLRGSILGILRAIYLLQQESGEVLVTLSEVRHTDESHRLLIDFVLEKTDLDISSWDMALKQSFPASRPAQLVQAAGIQAVMQWLQEMNADMAVTRRGALGAHFRLSFLAEPSALPGLPLGTLPMAASALIFAKRVLLVDDDPISRLATKRLLEGAFNCSVVSVGSAKAAIEQCDQSQAFDAALIDQFLPQMTGSELIRKLATRHCVAVIVAITGTLEREDEARLIAAGAHFAMEKPLSARALNEAFDAFGQRHIQ